MHLWVPVSTHTRQAHCTADASPQGAEPAERPSGDTKEIGDFFANCVRAFEIREMAAFSQQDKAGTGYCLRDVGRTFCGDEIIISMHDQRRDAEALEPVQQIVFVRSPRFVV